MLTAIKAHFDVSNDMLVNDVRLSEDQIDSVEMGRCSLEGDEVVVRSCKLRTAVIIFDTVTRRYSYLGQSVLI